MTLCMFSAVLHVSWPIYRFCHCILLRPLHSLYSRMEWPGNLQVHKPVCLAAWQLLAASWRWGHKMFPLTQRSHTQCDKQDNCWIYLFSEMKKKEQVNLSVTAVKVVLPQWCSAQLPNQKKILLTKHNLLPFFLCAYLQKIKQPKSMTVTQGKGGNFPSVHLHRPDFSSLVQPWPWMIWKSVWSLGSQKSSAVAPLNNISWTNSMGMYILRALLIVQRNEIHPPNQIL